MYSLHERQSIQKPDRNACNTVCCQDYSCILGMQDHRRTNCRECCHIDTFCFWQEYPKGRNICPSDYHTNNLLRLHYRNRDNNTLLETYLEKPMSEMSITKRFSNFYVGAVVGILLVAISVAVVMLTGTIKYNGVFKSIDFVMILLMLVGFVIQDAREEFLIYQRKSIHELHNVPVRFALI